jgi:hypothetical protein
MRQEGEFQSREKPARKKMRGKQAYLDTTATAVEPRRIWVSVNNQRSCASPTCFSQGPVEEGSSHTQPVSIGFDE